MTGRKQLSPSDKLSRFITSSNYISAEKNIVKRGAFMPPPHNGLSVFCTQNLQEGQIWSLANVILLNPPRRIEYRADITVNQVKQLHLDVDPDNIPEHHANITGWPGEKSEKMLLAQELASKATLKLRKLV
jgi:hypothetical protein